MPERSERGLGGSTEREPRFDGESVRKILQRAAVEQHRLSNELADTYSLEELEEMAAEARISREALGAAVEAHHHGAAARPAAARGAHPQGWLARLRSRMPGTWSPAARRIALTSAGVVVLVSVLVTVPAAAQVLLWTTLMSLIVLSVLVLVGVSPF